MEPKDRGISEGLVDPEERIDGPQVEVQIVAIANPEGDTEMNDQPSNERHPESVSTLSDAPNKQHHVLVSGSSKEASTSNDTEDAKWPNDSHSWSGLLPSPSSPVAMDIAGTKRPRELPPFHPSPATEWPQRSPMKSEHEDAALFNLFTQSFDTLGDDDTDRPLHHGIVAEHRQQQPPPPRNIALGQPRAADFGDISPIKLDSVHPSNTSGASLPRGLPDNHPGLPTPLEFQPRPYYEQRDQYGPTQWQEPSAASLYNHVPLTNPFYVLRSVRTAFEGISYKLPYLITDDSLKVNLSEYGSIHQYHDENGADSHTWKVAKRRVEAAVHAFGGYSTPSPSQPTSILRHRKTPSQEHYEESFHDRYACGSHHVSWEFEDNPPVRSERSTRKTFSDQEGQSPSGSEASEHSPHSNASVMASDNQQKMKYRCKLCGQPKQNHNCPYQQSLQRSIGVNVFPAVNAYTAMEPGVVTKPLQKMNNFVSYEQGQGYSPDHGRQPVSHVTPETKSRLVFHSPESSLSTHSDVASPYQQHPPNAAAVPRGCPAPPPHAAGGPPSPFLASIPLRPEHFRAVSQRQKQGPDEGFQYPRVPLTFKERKRLSDTLFFLSRDISGLTHETARLLAVAREREEWDLAVSEVLAQVVVSLYCPEGDFQLNGLQEYLLGMGIAC